MFTEKYQNNTVVKPQDPSHRSELKILISYCRIGDGVGTEWKSKDRILSQGLPKSGCIYIGHEGTVRHFIANKKHTQR